MMRKITYLWIFPLVLLHLVFYPYAVNASEKAKPQKEKNSKAESKPEQVAAFISKKNAVKFVCKLKDEGKNAFLLSKKGKDNKNYYVVYVKHSFENTEDKNPEALKTGQVVLNAVSEKRNTASALHAIESSNGAEKIEKGEETVLQAKAQDMQKPLFKATPQPVLIDFRDYVNKVLAANPSVKISEEDYRQTQIRFLRSLESYGVNVSLNGVAGLYYDKSSNTGAEISLDASKNLYDGGKRQVLEKELDVVKALAKASLLSSYDTAMLSAAAFYADFFYGQDVLDFLREQYDLQRVFIEKVESRFQKGVKFTIYDALTAQNEYLQLEKELLQQKTNIIKAEISFRQFGHIYTENPVKLAPFDISFKPDIDYLQKYAIVHNNSIFSARLQEEIQGYRVSERKAEGGIRVDAGSSIKFIAGSTGFTGGRNLNAGLSLRFTLPLLDGGVRKSDIVAEQIESLKQRLTLEKTTEDVIKNINDIHLDYQNLGKSLEILEQQLSINEKRLKISIERLEKGLEDYRAVRESWNDLIATKITLIQHKTLSQKLLVDLLILSGKSVFN